MQPKLTRRDFLRVAAMTAAGGALSACAAPATQSPEPTLAPPTQAPATAPPQAGNVKITMWSDDFLIIRFLNDRFNEYAGMHPETEFEFEFVELQVPDIVDKLISAFLAGTGAPDIIGLERGWFPRLLKEGLAEQGLYDLNPWLAAEGPGFKDKFLRWELYSWDGKTYGIDQDLCVCVYYYRKDIFDRAGLDPSSFQTYDDFVQAGQTLKAKTGSYMTIAEMASSTYPSLFLLQNGGGVFDQHGEVLLDSPESIQALQLYYDLSKTHQITYDVPEIWGAHLQPPFQEGAVAGAIAANWYTTWVLKETVPEQAGLWRVAPLPAFSPGGRRTTVWAGASLGITRQTEHAEIAWELLKHASLNQEQQVKKYLETGYFPTMLEAMADPQILEREEPFFGGQPVGGVFAELAPTIPFNHTHPYKAVALDLLSTEVIAPVMAGAKSPESALKATAQKLREMIIAGQ